ncbi:hypothetical protein [Actinokineospora bangkokensis]|uniref:Uncharacterized protein n=1 Tax=Actinokineospora bangkokensis TaxID=1193682 RepID=A0A1Q9LU91_9PSEU|nr:hypothetical protein [Actinokineospora bangkokensis]OLR95544.1 hypothetical protein BJP25_00145 [Actinokineospora bangkokensis]
MSGIPGRTAITETLKALPAQLTPPVELPGTPDELAAGAAAALGWAGTVLPEVVLFGRRVCLVADLLPDVHAERICLGQEPVTDKASVSTWAWPELAGRVPEPAVRIVGAIAVARHWRTGLANAVPFLRYGDAAVVLPTSAVLTHDYLVNCLPRARAYGVAVTSAEPDGAVQLDLPGRGDRAGAETDSTYRWVSELAYDQILDSAANGPRA